MPDITLVRQIQEPISEADRIAATRVLFGIVDGLGEIEKRKWRRFIGMLFRMGPGEIATVNTHKARSGPFHRRHMLLETRVFEAQERFTDFKRGFRDWLKVGAGHCDWYPGPKGGVMPVPKSTSYTEMEEGEMREFHDACLAFLRTAHAGKTLWPALSPLLRIHAIEAVLADFRE